MKAHQTRREGQTRQKSTPGREANVKTGLLLETTHMTTSFRRQRRESLGTRLSTWSIKITSFVLNNFAPEKFFWGDKSVSMNSRKFSNQTALWRRSQSNAISITISNRWPHVGHHRLVHPRSSKWLELVSILKFCFFFSQNQAQLSPYLPRCRSRMILQDFERFPKGFVWKYDCYVPSKQLSCK